MRYLRKDGEVVDAYEFAKLADAPREFAEAVCYGKHGAVNPQQHPHMHAYLQRASSSLHFICDGYWLFKKASSGLIYSINGKDFARGYQPLEEGRAA